MRKYILVAFTLLFTLNTLLAQPFPMNDAEMDNFSKKANGAAKDSTKVNALYWLSRANTLVNPNKTIEIANQGLSLAREIKYPIGEIECLEALCFAYAITASFEKGIKTAYDQIELSRKHAPIREIFGTNMMGLLYQKLGDDKEALNWAQKAYYHPQIKESDPFTQWSAIFLLAQEHERKNNLDSAYYFAQESLAYSKLHFKAQVGYPTLILARISSKRKDFDKAVEYCKQSISSSEQGGSGFFVNEAQNELAQMYFAQNKLDSAQNYAEIALEGAQRMKNYLVIMNSSFMLSQILEKKNPTKAYELLKISIVAKDTVTNLEKNKQVKQLEIKEKQRIEDLNLAEMYAKNELRFNTSIGLLISALVIALILYRNNRQKQKANALLEEQKKEINSQNMTLENTLTKLTAKNAENELLLKEIHHRVKNNLEVVSSLLALQSAQIDDPSVQDAMQASQNRVTSMGILHQKLYQSEHLAFIEMKNYFMNLSENILDSYNASERVTIDCAMNEIDLDVDTAVPIGLIVNELLTNSLKYAFKKDQLGTVKLSLVDMGQDNLQLKIADNGIGKSLVNKPQGTGFGTQLVDLLTKQLDGTIHQEINNGTIISINFKRAKAA